MGVLEDLGWNLICDPDVSRVIDALTAGILETSQHSDELMAGYREHIHQLPLFVAGIQQGLTLGFRRHPRMVCCARGLRDRSKERAVIVNARCGAGCQGDEE